MSRKLNTFVVLAVASVSVFLRPEGAMAQAISDGFSPRAKAFSCPAYEHALGAPLETVRYLADDALEGRFAGSRGASCAGDFIASMFASLGLEPAGEDGYFQELGLASVVNPHATAGSGRNVIALLPGSEAGLDQSTVVVGAHYDHLGHGEFGSTGETGEIHNGADDNASGVAAMLEAARLLADGPRPKRSILFIAFTGEELGLLGSSHYTKNPTRPLSLTLAMVNLDMVGRLGEEAMIVYGMGTAPEWTDLVNAANEDVDIPLLFEPDGYGPSDHTSFYSNEIPVLHFFTNVHRDYHRESDDWDKIDAEGVSRIARLTANVAAALANRETKLTLVPGVGAPSDRVGGNNAWLGTVPDFTPVDYGVLLGGVSEGGPASEADLRKGDIVIRIGDHDVADLQGMTDALAEHYPGDRVIVTFLRDGRRMTTTAILGNRAERP